MYDIIAVLCGPWRNEKKFGIFQDSHPDFDRINSAIVLFKRLEARQSSDPKLRIKPLMLILGDANEGRDISMFRLYAIAHGIKAVCTRFSSKASTQADAQNLGQFIKQSTPAVAIHLVTHHWHMQRAKAMCEHYCNTIITPHAVVSGPLPSDEMVLGESHGYTDFIKGRYKAGRAFVGKPKHGV